MMAGNGKTAIVTGASRGIGAAIAARLARDGFAVAVNYAGSQEAADSVVRDIVAAGGKAAAICADISISAHARRLFDEAESALGPASVLVNNAGVMALSSIAQTDDATFERQFDVNLRGSFHMLREAATRIADGGRIINLSTSALGLRMPGYGVYVATKAAVEALTGVLANELRGRSITVNAIAPGPTATELFMNGKSEEQVEKLAKMAPLERLATPDDIAAAVSFLAGPDGGWINGQVLRANGGLV